MEVSEHIVEAIPIHDDDTNVHASHHMIEHQRIHFGMCLAERRGCFQERQVGLVPDATRLGNERRGAGTPYRTTVRNELDRA